tara:strand:+ start:71 stop:295 length:225 start_codon:yes stop_codon:yes gene_type:complete
MSSTKEEQDFLFDTIGEHFDTFEEVTLPQELAKIERTTISEKLVEFNGNRTRTANALGIGRTNLVKKLKKYSLA